MTHVFDNTPEEQLRSVHEAFSDVILCLTDEELDTEIRERGEDPAQVAERTREIMRSAVKAFQEKQLHPLQPEPDPSPHTTLPLLAKSPGGTNPTIC